VDLEMLAAVDTAAVDYLVTDDGQLPARARRAGHRADDPEAVHRQEIEDSGHGFM
jgi:hypothetical protein